MCTYYLFIKLWSEAVSSISSNKHSKGQTINIYGMNEWMSKCICIPTLCRHRIIAVNDLSRLYFLLYFNFISFTEIALLKFNHSLLIIKPNSFISDSIYLTFPKLSETLNVNSSFPLTSIFLSLRTSDTIYLNHAYCFPRPLLSALLLYFPF